MADEKTSSEVAREASRILKDPNASAAMKKVAASALTQTEDKRPAADVDEEHPVAKANRVIDEENKNRGEYADSRTYVDDKRVSDGKPAPWVITEETASANTDLATGAPGGNVGGDKVISGAGVTSAPTHTGTDTSGGKTDTSSESSK